MVEQKLRQEILRLKSENKRLQEQCNLMLGNNTGCQMLLPSEFKDKWNYLCSDLLLDAFDSDQILEDHRKFKSVVQQIFQKVMGLIQSKIEEVIAQVSRALCEKGGDRFKAIVRDHVMVVFR